MRTVLGRTDRVVVVGAGLAGLSATLRLLAAGREVTVLERETEPGGAARSLRVAGYRYDAGPTVLTMPHLIEAALACVGERLDVPLTRLDPAYRAHFADGSRLDVRADVAATEAEIARVCGAREARGYREFVAAAARLYRLEYGRFIDRNLDSVRDLARPAAAGLLAAGALRSLDRWIGRFFADPRTRRLFSFQALYAGVSPWQARALYAVIPFMDTVAGVYYPAGGLHGVATALAGAAARHGARLRYADPAVRVELCGARAVAVHTAAGERLPADVVVLAGGVAAGYRLLGRSPRRRPRIAPSCVLLLAGGGAGAPAGPARRDPPPGPPAEPPAAPAQHNLHFGAAWRSTFDELLHQGRLMSDPSLLVGIPSVTDPAAAPAGRHAYHVLAPVPNLDARLDWARLGPRYRDELAARLRALGYPELGEAERVLTPADWAAAGYPKGSPFGPAHTFTQTGPLRQPTLSAGLENVVFAGAGAQPGIGVPMVLISGRLAAERVTGGGRCR